MRKLWALAPGSTVVAHQTRARAREQTDVRDRMIGVLLV